MEAIQGLMEEHRLIERVLDALDALAAAAAAGEGDGREELGRHVTFLRELADKCHHGKEEDVLFRAMVEAGFPSQGGPVAVMLHEHAIGRSHIQGMERLAGSAAPWSAADRQQVLAEASGYSDLLRGHIQREDEILYPMAQARLPASLQARVDDSCRALDQAWEKSGSTARLRQLAEELIARAGARSGR